MAFRSAAPVAAFVAIVWGLCFVLIQAALPSRAPLFLAAQRSLLGGALLAGWLAVSAQRQRPHDMPRRLLPAIPLLVALSITNSALAFGAMYLAAGRTEAAVASILSGGQPLVLAVAGAALFGERLSARGAGGLAVAMLGVVLVAGASGGYASLEGIVLALLAAVAPAGGTILMRALGRSIDLAATTSAQFLLGGAILLVASAFLEPWQGLDWSWPSVLSLLVLGVLGTGVAYVAWFWLLERLSLVRLGAILYLVPVVGVGAGFLGGDRLSAAELAGIGAMLAGIALVSLPERPVRRELVPPEIGPS